jgi:hypothetical protein
MLEPSGAAFILTAKSLNPSIFNQIWLSREKLVEDSEFGPQSITTAGASQHQIAKLALLVVPDRLQLLINPFERESMDRADSLCAGIVARLPHTPYLALGINFDFAPTVSNAAAVTRKLLGVNDARLAAAFDDPSATFAGTLSKPIRDGQLNFRIAIAEGQKKEESSLALQFNHHFDLSSLAPESVGDEVARLVHSWDTLREEASRLTEIVLTSASSVIDEVGRQ